MPTTITASTARSLRAELARLERATTTIHAFKVRHDARKAEIIAVLSNSVIEPEHIQEDPRVVQILRASAGGDRLDGNRHW